MRFDYYTAGIEASPQRVLDCIASQIDLSDVEPATPKNGYERAYNVTRGDTVHARVQFGGTNVGTRVYASASGDASPEFARIIRDEFPEHLLIRADVAIDYCESGAWDSLSTLALEVADKYRLKVKHSGDFHRQQDGRTLYIGSRKSPVFQRVYEKGKQQNTDPDWVRAEVEIKPKTERAREAFAKAQPADMWAAAKWSQSFLRTLTDVVGIRPAPPGTVRTKTDHERALEHLARQYGRILGVELERVGGDVAAFGQFVADLIIEVRSDT
jgi:hypothetical protein